MPFLNTEIPVLPNIVGIGGPKRARATCSYLLCFHFTVIHPVIEYANPVWHCSLTVSQSDILESLQKQAMNIIFPGYDYKTLLTIHGVDTLCSHREELTWHFFCSTRAE